MKNLSLRKRITYSVVFMFFIFSVAVSAFLYFYLVNKLSQDRLESIKKIAIEQVHESTQIIMKDEVFTKMLGTRTRVKEYLLNPTEAKRVELLGIYSDYANEDSKYLSIYLLDKTGMALISTDLKFVGQNYAFRDYFIEAMAGRPHIDVAIGKTTGQFGYYFSYPVKNGDQIIGVQVVKIDNKEIDNAILDSELAKDGTIMFTDQYGVILTSNRQDRFLKSLGQISIQGQQEITRTERFLNKEIVPLQYDDAQKIIDAKIDGSYTFNDVEDGEDETVYVNRFSNLPFYLVSEIGLETLQESVMSIVVNVILILLVGLIIISLIVNHAFVSFVAPLQKFREVSEAINKGDFSKKVEIPTKGEFSDLADVFNNMSAGLANTYKALEDKVEEKTAELQKEMEKKEENLDQVLANMNKELENKVEERTAELKKSLDETERLNKIMVDRELKMIELKKKLDECEKNKNV